MVSLLQFDDDFPEKVHVIEPRRHLTEDGPRWSLYKTAVGVWTDDYDTEKQSGPTTMHRAFGCHSGYH
jgi:hypothetical protein